MLSQDELGGGFAASVERGQRFVLFVLILAVAVLVFVQVLLRYVFRAPLMGIEEILLFPTIWLYFIGGINASAEETQIVARVLEVFVKNQRTVRLIRLVASIISVVVLAWLTYWAYDYFAYSQMMGKTSPTLYIPLIYADFASVVGFALMGVYTVRTVFQRMKTLDSGEAPEA